MSIYFYESFSLCLMEVKVKNNFVYVNKFHENLQNKKRNLFTFMKNCEESKTYLILQILSWK